MPRRRSRVKTVSACCGQKKGADDAQKGVEIMLHKVKHHKGQTEVVWDEVTGAGDSIEHRLVSADPPRPELRTGLQKLAAYVLETCELPRGYGERLTVISVSLNYNDKLGRGLTVTSLRDVDTADSPVVINTPHLTEMRWPMYLAPLVENLVKEAESFRLGRRAQTELPLRAEADQITDDPTVSIEAPDGKVLLGPIKSSEFSKIAKKISERGAKANGAEAAQ
jgi:hypothetical protein